MSYIEAHSCAYSLEALGREVTAPLQEVELPVGDNGVRLPVLGEDQLQTLLCAAVVRGMTLGVAAKEPWVVQNGAILAWNAFLPLLQNSRSVGLHFWVENAGIQ